MNDNETFGILIDTLRANNIGYYNPEAQFSCVPNYLKNMPGLEVIIYGSPIPMIKHYIALRVVDNQIHLNFFEPKFVVPCSGLKYLTDLCNKLNQNQTTGRFLVIQHPKSRREGTDPKYLINMAFCIDLTHLDVQDFIKRCFLMMLYKIETDYKNLALDVVVPFLTKMQILLTKMVTNYINISQPREEICKAIKAVLNGIGFKMIKEKTITRGADTYYCFLIGVSTGDQSKGKNE